MVEHPNESPRSWLDRFSDTAANAASKPPLLLIVVVMILVWLVAHLLGASSVALLIIEVFEAITLTLVVLLQNSERRAEGAVNEKLDLQAEALAMLLEDGQPEMAERLRESIALEE